MNTGAHHTIRQIQASPPAAPSDARAVSDAYVHVLDSSESFRTIVAAQLRGHKVNVLTYSSADQFVATYVPQDVECLIAELSLPGLPVYQLLDQLRSRHVLSPVIVVSDRAGTADIVAAVQRGATDFLEKPIPEHVLAEKVGAALAKDQANKSRRGNFERRLDKLTDRERQVMRLLVAAKTTIEAAHKLGISPKTVEKHRVRVFEKLDVPSVPALIRLVCDIADDEV
jgi:two-component system response regulator FixJ